MGLTVVSLFSEDTRREAANPTAQQAFICNLKSHWFTIRRLGAHWFNLNSLLKKGTCDHHPAPAPPPRSLLVIRP